MGGERGGERGSQCIEGKGRMVAYHSAHAELSGGIDVAQRDGDGVARRRVATPASRRKLQSARVPPTGVRCGYGVASEALSGEEGSGAEPG